MALPLQKKKKWVDNHEIYRGGVLNPTYPSPLSNAKINFYMYMQN